MKKSKVIGLLTAIIMLVMVYMPISKVYASPDDDDTNTDNTVYDNNTVDSDVNNTVDDTIDKDVDNDTGDNNTTPYLRGPANNTRNVQTSPVTITFSDGMSIEEEDFSDRELACLDLLDEKGLFCPVYADRMQEIYGKNNKLLLYYSRMGIIFFADDVSSADNIEYTLTDEDRAYDEYLSDVSKINIVFSGEKLDKTLECRITDGMKLDAQMTLSSEDIDKMIIIEFCIEKGLLIINEDYIDENSEVPVYSADGKLLFTLTHDDDDDMTTVHLAEGISYLDNIESEITPEERVTFIMVGLMTNRDLECTRILLSFGDAPLEFIDGENQTYVIGSGKTITLKASGDLDKLTGVKMNGTLVDQSCYEAVSGSTIITFSNEYLDSLEEGTYEVSLVYGDRELSTNLTIKESDSVKAGDIGIVLWVALIVTSIGLIVKMKK